MALNAYLEALKSGEEFMLRALMDYASEAEYTRFASMREEDWRQILRQSARELVAYLERSDKPDSFNADEQFDESPAAVFAVLEAQRHRERGVSFEMYLGLCKLVRQTFIDLLDETAMKKSELKLALAITHRFWDKFELSFASEWFHQGKADALNELQEANRRMTKEKNRYRTIFQSISEPVFVVDQQLCLVEVNAAFEQLLHVSQAQIKGKPCHDVVRCESPCEECPLERAIRSGSRFSEVETTIRLNDQTKDVLFSGSFLDDISGKFAGGVGILQDITDRKQAEKKARFLGEITEQVNDAIIVTDLDYRITYVNRSFQRLYGYATEELLGELPDVLNAEPQAENIQKEIYRAVSSGEVWQGEVLNRRRDGSTFLCELTIFPLVDEQGAIFAYAGAQRDITERKKTEEALRESEAFIKAVLDNLPVGIAVNSVDPAVNFEYMNDYFPKYYRTTRERLVDPDAFWEAVYEEPEFRERIKQRVLDDCASGDPERMHWVDVPLTRQGEETAFITAMNIPIPDKQLMISVVWDITERKRAEEALRESEEKYRSLFETMAQGVVYQDAEGRILLANPAAERILGLSLAQLQGRTSMDPRWRAIHEDGSDFCGETHPPMVALRTGKEVLGEVMGVFNPSTEKHTWILINAFPQFSPGERTPGQVFTTFQDITERKQAEEERLSLEQQVRHAQKLESLGVLAGGIAHDFNNLLMAVLGNADIALQELPPASPARPLIEEVLKGARRGAELSGQMLAYSGKGAFVKHIIDLRELLSETTHLLEASIPKAIRVQYHLPDSLPAINADVTQLHQVIMNLVLNAAEATGDEGGFITVRAGARDCKPKYLKNRYLPDDLPGGKYVYLDVIDTGCGMDEESLEKLFDPFFTTKFTGRGLGLAATLGIIRGHQGAVKVESELGKGTTFRVLFPAVEEPAVRQLTAVQESKDWTGTGTGTVLLVDDVLAVREVGKKMLDRLGFTVLLAADGEEGIGIYRQRVDEITCVLLDLSMPKMGGEKAFEELIKIDQEACVIISSGYSEQEIADKFAGKSIAGFIQKPYTLAKLKEKLRQALGG